MPSTAHFWTALTTRCLSGAHNFCVNMAKENEWYMQNWTAGARYEIASQFYNVAATDCVENTWLLMTRDMTEEQSLNEKVDYGDLGTLAPAVAFSQMTWAVSFAAADMFRELDWVCSLIKPNETAAVDLSIDLRGSTSLFIASVCVLCVCVLLVVVFVVHEFKLKKTEQLSHTPLA